MKIKRTGNTIKLWLSANDTYNWAHKPGASWPCSQLSGKRLFAEFADFGDLVDYTVDGKNGVDVDGQEFTAITNDFLNNEDRTMKTKIFQNQDGTCCVRRGSVTWLFPDIRQAERFYRTLLRG